jgi:hypothetical protein
MVSWKNTSGLRSSCAIDAKSTQDVVVLKRYLNSRIRGDVSASPLFFENVLSAKVFHPFFPMPKHFNQEVSFFSPPLLTLLWLHSRVSGFACPEAQAARNRWHFRI